MNHTVRRTSARLGAIVVTTTAALLAAASAGFAALPPGPASLTPVTTTPHFPTTTSATEQVRQLVECGSTMYAVGTFSTVKSGSTTFTRNGAFSFSATSPYTMTGWDPEVNGTVDSIGFNGTDCSHAYLGGTFTSVHGTTVKNLAEVDANGAVVGGFKNNAGGEVDTILGWNGHMFVGGKFTSIGGGTANPYFASLNPTTGSDDGYLHLNISGHYVFTDPSGHATASNPTKVYNQQLSHAGNRLLVEGDFTSIGGQPRRQIAMLDLGATGATTDAWYATEFDANCVVNEPFYARDASWSPDDSTVYAATTGRAPVSGPGSISSQPRAGLCDAASAFPSTAGQVTHKWINYTGCDSLYSSVADTSTAYFGGHERWASNSRGCDQVGPGAINAPGMVGLSPSSGAVTYNPTRARGLGADDMIVTPQGLWIASDNYQGSNKCGGVANLAGICLLPY